MEISGRKKLLFVCARNKIRSLTAEKMLTGSPQYAVRSRGVANDARVRLTAADLGWADIVFVMEKNHKNRITARFRKELADKEIVCLFIKDIYEPTEDSLVAELHHKLAPHLGLPSEKSVKIQEPPGTLAAIDKGLLSLATEPTISAEEMRRKLKVWTNR
jgi:protein-tyrosine phosphatase